jgi:hypothetical protein
MPSKLEILSVVAAGLLAVTGCDKDKDDAQSKKDGDAKAEKAEGNDGDEAKTEADAPPKDDGPFAEFDLPGLAKKWEGAWLIDGGRLAWEVKGGELTIVDGKGDDKSRGFEVQAPCQVASIERGESGSTSTFHKFAFDGDTLYTGLGNAGVKKGDAVVACVSNKVYVLKDGKCESWRQVPFDKSKWESSEATCSLSTEDDVETFEVEGTKLEVVGEALVDAQMKRKEAERKGSLDEARAALQ